MTTLSFSHFCDYVRACYIQSTPKRAGQKRTAQQGDAIDFFRQWRVALPAELADGTGAILFRMLFPDKDIRRRYNMKETLLAQQLVKVFRLSTGRGSKGWALMRWNADEDEDAVARSGCLGLELASILATDVRFPL